MMTAVAGVACSDGAAQQKELAQIQRRFQQLNKEVTDRFTSDEELTNAAADLKDLLAQTNELVTATEKTTGFEQQVINTQTEILNALKTVEQRLPGDVLSGGRIGLSGVTGLGVPVYDPNTTIGQLATEVRKAQVELRNHYRKPERAAKDTRRLLQQLVLAEEKLAWEVGWPFTSAEIRKLKAQEESDALTEEVYHSRRERGVKRINEHLKQQFESVGRGAPRPFVVHTPNDKAEQRTIAMVLAKTRGDFDFWSRGVKPFDDTQRRILLGEQVDEPASKDETVTDTPPEPATPRPVREWADAFGIKIKASFVSLSAGKVKLKTPDGKIMEMDLKELSPADRAYIEKLGL